MIYGPTIRSQGENRQFRSDVKNRENTINHLQVGTHFVAPSLGHSSDRKRRCLWGCIGDDYSLGDNNNAWAWSLLLLLSVRYLIFWSWFARACLLSLLRANPSGISCQFRFVFTSASASYFLVHNIRKRESLNSGRDSSVMLSNASSGSQWYRRARYRLDGANDDARYPTWVFCVQQTWISLETPHQAVHRGWHIVDSKDSNESRIPKFRERKKMLDSFDNISLWLGSVHISRKVTNLCFCLPINVLL